MIESDTLNSSFDFRPLYRNASCNHRAQLQNTAWAPPSPELHQHYKSDLPKDAPNYLRSILLHSGGVYAVCSIGKDLGFWSSRGASLGEGKAGAEVQDT